MTVYVEETTLEALQCAQCAMTFAVPEEWLERRRNDHQPFRCPAGHSNIYSGKSDLEKREQAERCRADRLAARLVSTEDQLEATERSRRAAKGQVTKIKNRIAKGICPHCYRHFTNVERHMATKHKEPS